MPFLRAGCLLPWLMMLGSCCSALTPTGEVVRAPDVVIRGVFAGWIVGADSTPPRTRDLQTWEIRIALDGTTQEARGWRAADGFLPPANISPAEARHFYELARGLADLPDFVGQISSDVPYRQIETTIDGVTRTISGYTAARSDADAERFNRVWTEIARRFPERAVCR